MKLEIIVNDKGEIYTLFEPGGIATTHTKVCLIKKLLGIDHVGIAPPDLWKEMRQKYKVQVLENLG